MINLLGIGQTERAVLSSRWREFYDEWFGGGFGLVPNVTILGAPLYVHWSAAVLAGVLLVVWIRQPLYAIECVCCYFALILLHEIGHAAMARRLGYSTQGIYLSGIHGLCLCDYPDTKRDECLIAWGGVVAQLTLAVPLIALAHIPMISRLPFVGIFIATFGYFSVVMAVFNLIPAAPLDGAKAWRLFPTLLADVWAWRRAKKATRELFKRLK